MIYSIVCQNYSILERETHLRSHTPASSGQKHRAGDPLPRDVLLSCLVVHTSCPAVSDKSPYFAAIVLYADGRIPRTRRILIPSL